MLARPRTFALIALTVAFTAAAPAAQAPAPKVTSPEQFFGHKIGADYVLPNYTKFTEFVNKLDAESDRMTRAEHRQDRRRPRSADGDHHGAGELQEPQALSGHLPPAVARRRPHRRSGARAGEGRQGGGLDRRRPARHRGPRRAAADGDDLSAREPHRRRDDAAAARRRHPLRPRQSRRHGAGLRLVHAQAGREDAQHRRPSRGSIRSTSATTTTATSTR